MTPDNLKFLIKRNLVIIYYISTVENKGFIDQLLKNYFDTKFHQTISAENVGDVAPVKYACLIVSW